MSIKIIRPIVQTAIATGEISEDQVATITSNKGDFVSKAESREIARLRDGLRSGAVKDPDAAASYLNGIEYRPGQRASEFFHHLSRSVAFPYGIAYMLTDSASPVVRHIVCGVGVGVSVLLSPITAPIGAIAGFANSVGD